MANKRNAILVNEELLMIGASFNDNTITRRSLVYSVLYTPSMFDVDSVTVAIVVTLLISGGVFVVLVLIRICTAVLVLPITFSTAGCRS